MNRTFSRAGRYNSTQAIGLRNLQRGIDQHAALVLAVVQGAPQGILDGAHTEQPGV